MPREAPQATYFTPSNFCDFSLFSSELFHDSNTANPGTPTLPPELKPENGTGGGGGTPPETPPAVKIASIQLTSPVSASAYSKEGQKPVLDGLKVRVIYDSSS